MVLVSAQTMPLDRDIKSNLKEHYRFIGAAADYGADLIVFPEMSITGYLRENAEKFAFSENDSRLDNLRKLSADYNMFILAGAPLIIKSDLYIGPFIIDPDKTVSVYTKQFLHSGEEEYFKSSFNYDPVIRLGTEYVTLAICADIDNPLHPEDASESGTTIYIPSIFFSVNGIEGTHRALSSYAKKYSMQVLMSNYCGKLWEMTAGGRSAFWDAQGRLIMELDDSHPGLLIVEKENNQWSGKTIYM